MRSKSQQLFLTHTALPLLSVLSGSASRQILYHGSRKDLPGYFQGLGFIPPPADEARTLDFVLDPAACTAWVAAAPYAISGRGLSEGISCAGRRGHGGLDNDPRYPPWRGGPSRRLVLSSDPATHKAV